MDCVTKPGALWDSWGGCHVPCPSKTVGKHDRVKILYFYKRLLGAGPAVARGCVGVLLRASKGGALPLDVTVTSGDEEAGRRRPADG